MVIKTKGLVNYMLEIS